MSHIAPLCVLLVLVVGQAIAAIDKTWKSDFQGEATFTGNRAPIVANHTASDDGIVVSILQAPNMAAAVAANDRKKGTLLWQHTIDNVLFEPHISSAAGSVFVVLGTKTVALDLSTGNKKWESSSPSGGTAAATYIPSTDSVIVYTNDHLRSIDASAANGGNITWSVQSTFGQCDYFKKPFYTGGSVFLVCGRSPTSGMTGIAAYHVKTGALVYFKEHTNPNPFFANATYVVYLDMNHATHGFTEDVVHCVDGETGAHLWKFHPNHEHTAGVVVTSADLVVIGTWGTNYALHLKTGVVAWHLLDPFGPTFRTFPFACGTSSGMAFFHLQEEMNFRQAMRRIQLDDGSVRWNSSVPIHSNGLLQFHYVASQDVIAMRGKNTIRVWSWNNGTEIATKDIHEIDVTVWEGDHVYLGKESKLTSYQLV